MLRKALASLAAAGLAMTMVSSYYSMKEMAVLRTEAKELKTQFDIVEENISSRKQYIQVLNTKLNSIKVENQLLWDDVENLTSKLYHQKLKTNDMVDLYREERARVNDQYQAAVILKRNREEIELLVSKESNKKQVLKLELSKIQGELDELAEQYENIHENYMFLQEEYDVDINAEKEKQAILQEKIDTLKKMHDQQVQQCQ